MKKLFESNFQYYENKSGIYLITISNYTYIGSSKNLYLRSKQHKSRMKKNKHHNTFVQNCFNKYGKDFTYFSILELCKEKELVIREQYYIDSLKPNMNIVTDAIRNIPEVGFRSNEKVVYQYTLSGNYLAEFPSAQEAGRKLNLNGNTITKVCTGNHGHKSYAKSLWSYEKHDKLPNYVNNSDKAKIKAVTMYDKQGNRLKRFKSIADAAREIEEPGDDFDSLCASISSVASGKGLFVRNKYTFSYKDQNILEINLSKNYPIIQILPDGKIVEWDTVLDAANTLSINAGGIRKVLRGERKKYIGSEWQRK